jgi:hypothetical protein
MPMPLAVRTVLDSGPFEYQTWMPGALLG